MLNKVMYKFNETTKKTNAKKCKDNLCLRSQDDIFVLDLKRKLKKKNKRLWNNEN